MRHSTTGERVAVVTGAARGLGRTIADHLMTAGATVVGFDVSGTALDQARVEPGGFTCWSVDVSQEDSVAAAAALIREQAGRLDVLVNNAGVIYKAAIGDIELARWSKVIAINLTGPMLCAKHLVDLISQSPIGRIVNISSMTANVGLRTYSAYSASKAGLSNLTKVWAAELANDGVTVNAICPSWVSTPMTEDGLMRHLGHRADISPIEARKRLISRLPQRRLIESSEIAALVVFLASDAAQAISGVEIALDAGLRATFDVDELVEHAPQKAVD